MLNKNLTQPDFSFTTFTAAGGTKLNKSYYLDGGVIKKMVPANLYEGTYQTENASDLHAFNSGLNSLENYHALCIGTSLHGESGHIVSRGNKKAGAITRTKENFEFSNCFFFDIDNSMLKIDEVISSLSNVDPNLATANILVRPSSSYGISIQGEQPDDLICGYHVWVFGVKEPSDIARYGKAFAQRCWLSNLGHIQLSKTGAMLVRQLIDDSVFSPERLVFEASPTIGEGITQLERQHFIQEGNVLDTSLLPSLTAKELINYESLVSEAKLEKINESDELKANYITSRVQESVDSGIDKDLALRHVEASLASGELYGSHWLCFKDEPAPICVADVLASPAQYDGKTLADPMEPDYNNSDTVAKFYANVSTNNPIVNSFAHGDGKTYKLKQDPHNVKPTVNSYNTTLDTEGKYVRIDLLQYLDDDHLIKKLSANIGDAMHMSHSTVLLAGLGVFAALSARKYTVCYRDGNQLPLGLYIVIEQPSGSGKSRCLNYFQDPFSEYQKSRSKELRILINDSKDPEASELNENLDAITPSFGITNATPEGLELTLLKTNGFFSAISSEQGLFNSLFGAAYLTKGRVSNNDTVLNGFDGGHIACSRAGRDGYVGNVVGGIVSFAQDGSIQSLLNTASGSGLSERFLMAAEPNLFGSRDHMKKLPVDTMLLKEYQECCADIFPALEQACDIDDLVKMRFTETGYNMISRNQNFLEPHLGDGEKYSYDALRGAVSKSNMQVMKIAAVLYLLDDTKTKEAPTGKILIVDDQYVIAAIGIVNELLEASLKLCQTKGIIGDKAEFDSILSLFEMRPAPRSERSILKAKIKTLPFKNHTGNKSQKVRDTLLLMLEQGILSLEATDKGVNMYSMAQ